MEDEKKKMLNGIVTEYTEPEPENYEKEKSRKRHITKNFKPISINIYYLLK